MNGKGYSDSMTIGLISVVCIAFVLSVYFFASMFVFTGPDIVDELPNNDPTIENKDPVVDPEIEAKIQALKKEIETYDKILSSNYMLLVNKSNPIPEDFNQTSLMDTESNPAVKLEAVTAIKIQEFIDAARQAGYTCKVISGYKTYADQEALYNQMFQSEINAGYTAEEAESRVGLTVAKPGYSEFETGYTVCIAETSSMTKDEMINSDLYKFISENIYKYGFILRYPEGKKDITGYEFDPFCYRYVGDVGVADGILSMSHAQYIYEKSISFEEYIDYVKAKRSYAVQNLNVSTAE
ncbi:MAG: D-alanyl-D-alanine carboxypeptidase family protein [Ruminococcaceae bacterium]|nr:D-alanyl-D-alanine carboxypeptidase family protein [Oscillospiraceae bacterium]